MQVEQSSDNLQRLQLNCILLLHDFQKEDVQSCSTKAHKWRNVLIKDN
jgi:hypothetical protein